jgi:hypothetical protein
LSEGGKKDASPLLCPSISDGSYTGTGFRKLRRVPDAERSIGIISVDAEADLRPVYFGVCDGRDTSTEKRRRLSVAFTAGMWMAMSWSRVVEDGGWRPDDEVDARRWVVAYGNTAIGEFLGGVEDGVDFSSSLMELKSSRECVVGAAMTGGPMSSRMPPMESDVP